MVLRSLYAVSVMKILKDVCHDVREKLYSRCPTAFICPANTNRMMAAFIVWPQRPGSWSFGAVAACEAFTAVIKAIAASEKVYVICGAKHFAVAQEYLAGVANVELLAMETDDSWARDIGPTFVVRDGAQGRELRGVNWRFNAWGGGGRRPVSRL